MKATGIVALSLLGFAAAAPYKHFEQKAKRDLVWVTHTAEVVETVVQTTTVWVDPTEEAQDYTPTPTPELTTETTTKNTSVYTPTPEPTSTEAPVTTEEPSTSSTSSVYTPPAPTTTETPTSTYVAPTTTETPSSTSTYVAPTTEATSSAVPTSSAVVAAEDTSSSSMTGALAGDKDNCQATWYNTLGAYAACGTQHWDTESVVALKSSTFNTYKSEICGKKITLEYNGKTTTATLVDSCPGCNGEWDIDLSPPVFEALTGDLGVGRISGMTWHFD